MKALYLLIKQLHVQMKLSLSEILSNIFPSLPSSFHRVFLPGDLEQKEVQKVCAEAEEGNTISASWVGGHRDQLPGEARRVRVWFGSFCTDPPGQGTTEPAVL